MFTGIIEEIGHVKAVKKQTFSQVIVIEASKVLEGTKIGDSIAVNGICLTVTAIEKGQFSADVMHETVKRTSLKNIRAGSHVNLERAMGADGRFGGHIVSGHIDGTGTVTDIRKDDNAVWYRISADDGILKYVVEKGSITIDGISLTVASVTDKYFEVSVIPHTREVTILRIYNTSKIQIINNLLIINPVNLGNYLSIRYLLCMKCKHYILFINTCERNK